MVGWYKFPVAFNASYRTADTKVNVVLPAGYYEVISVNCGIVQLSAVGRMQVGQVSRFLVKEDVLKGAAKVSDAEIARAKERANRV